MKKTLALALMIGSLAACSSEDPASSRDAHLAKGDALLAEDKLAEATIEYRLAVQADQLSGPARKKLAEAYLKADDLPRATEQFVRAADLLPDDVDVQLQAGRLLILGGYFDDARGRAEKILAIQPRHIDAQILKANALAGLRDFESALAQAQRTTEIDPTRSEPYSNLGALQFARGDVGAAEASIKRAIATAPDKLNARLALANLYWASNRRGLAEEAIREALKLEPRHALANRFLASLYLGTRRFAEAEAPLKVVAETDGGTEAWLGLGDYYVQVNRPADARKIYEQVAASPEGATPGKLRLSALGFIEGNRAEAHRLVDEVLSREPNNVEALIGRAQLLISDGRLDDALVSARAAVASGPRVPLGHFVLGRILTSQYQMDEAKAAFAGALQASSRFAPANVELARLALRENNFADAIRHAQAAITVAPAMGEAHLLLARAHIANGDPTAAEASIQLMSQNFPDSPSVLIEVGRLQLAKGNRAAARAALNAAITRDPGSPAAVEGLVALDLQDKQVAAARSRLDTAVANAPPGSELQLVAARLYATTFGDRPAAEAAVKRLLAVEPNNLAAFDVLARIYATSQNLPAATAEFEKLVERQPRNVGNHTAVGVLYQLQGNLDSARAAYERALAIDPRAGVAANNLAGIYGEKNENLDVALQLAQTAKATLPNSHEVDDTLGWLYYKKAQGPQAVTALKAAVAAQPDNALYLYHLGAAQVLVRDRSSARQSLERALKLQADFPGADDARKILASLN